MILFDYIGNRACEEIDRKFKDYLKRNELQKILLQCFRDAGIKIDDDIEEKILSVEPYKIRPNMSKEEIKVNLEEELFNIIIDNNEEYNGKANNVKECICSKYLDKARKNILELYHILEVLDDVKADITDLIKVSEKQQEASEKVDKLYAELLKSGGREIHFIEELNTSKVFFFCEIEISTDFYGIEETLDDIFEQVREEIGVTLNKEYEEGEFFYNIYVQFSEPLLQYRFRKFLKQINDLFYQEGIQIARITSHF